MMPVVVEPADTVGVAPASLMPPTDVVVGVAGVTGALATDVVPPSEMPPATGTDTGAGGATGAGGVTVPLGEPVLPPG